MLDVERGIFFCKMLYTYFLKKICCNCTFFNGCIILLIWLCIVSIRIGFFSLQLGRYMNFAYLKLSSYDIRFI